MIGPAHRRSEIAWLVGAAFTLAAFIPEADARPWRYANGRTTFEADFVRMDGAVAVFQSGGEESRHPLRLLSPTDQHHIRTLAQSDATESAPPGGSSAEPVRELTFGGQPLKEGEELIVELPVTNTGMLRVLKDSYGRESTKARTLIAVPPGFDPFKKRHPVLIVSCTTDGDASSVDAAKAYLTDALGRGFVVLAVNGEFGKPNNDSTTFRWTLVQAALDALHEQWPDSKSWPVATGGISGGGGYASHQAIMLVQEKYNVIGMFLSVSGWNPTNFPAVLKRAPSGKMRRVPIFMSAGETDTIATPEITGRARQDVERDGFKNVRFEKFPGGHEMHHPHLLAALDWFLEQDAKSP